MNWFFPLIVLMVAVGSVAALRYMRRKGPFKNSRPRAGLSKLVGHNPKSASLSLMGVGNKPKKMLGAVCFLRAGGGMHVEDNAVLVTVPKAIDHERVYKLHAKDRRVLLRFAVQGVPHAIRCRTRGYARVSSELAKRLDFKVESALRLVPIGRLRKEEDRGFKRYVVKSQNGASPESRPYVTFEVFAKGTALRYDDKKALPARLEEPNIESPAGAFFGEDALSQLRDLVMVKPPQERTVGLTRIAAVTGQESADSRKQGSRRSRRVSRRWIKSRPRTGDPLISFVKGVRILDLERRFGSDLVFLRKTDGLLPGDRVLLHFEGSGKHCEVEGEIAESSNRKDVVRLTDVLRVEEGLRLELVDHSAGGLLVEGSREFLQILGEEKTIFEQLVEGNSERAAMLERIREPLIHLTLYPRFTIPESLDRFEPDLPARINVIAQITSTRVRSGEGHEPIVVKHGLRFLYDPARFPLGPEDRCFWNLRKDANDNAYLAELYRKLGQLYAKLASRELRHQKSKTADSEAA